MVSYGIGVCVCVCVCVCVRVYVCARVCVQALGGLVQASFYASGAVLPVTADHTVPPPPPPSPSPLPPAGAVIHLPATYSLDTTSGYYYDSSTGLYYDPNSGVRVC